MKKVYGILIRTPENNKIIVKQIRDPGWACHRIEYEEKHIKELD